MDDARVNQPRLFQTGNDFDGMTQCRARPFQKPALTFGPTQSVSTHDADAVRVHSAQALPKALQTAQCAFGGRIIESVAVVQAGRQAHHFAQTIEYDELPVRMTGDDHVEAVRA